MRRLIIIIQFFVMTCAFGQLNVPGSFSLTDEGRPATDLVYQGNLLSIPEAISLREEGYDLSTLNPSESDIWNAEGFSREELSEDFESTLMNFQGVLLSRLGNFRFNAKPQGSSLVEEGFTFLAGKKAFVSLIRQELLAKLGYRVQPMKRVSTLRLQFRTETEKNQFIEDFTQASFADPRTDRWVKEEGVDWLILQDLVAMPQDTAFYNLSLGAMSRDLIGGRRVLNALLPAFNLADVSESINLFSFESHRKIGSNVTLSYELAQEFRSSAEDFKWMLRKIESLDRSDWEEIVANADLPEAVSALIVEKLISRRNALLKAVELPFHEISFDPQVSLGSDLKDGKLQKENWTGYASRFAYGDPDTPLNGTEILNFFKSKALSNIILNVMTVFNTEFLKPDIGTQDIINEQFDQARLDYLFKVFDGTSSRNDLYFFSYPTLNGSAIINRAVNIGGIEGGESKIMLADTFGFRVNAGMRVGTFDFPVVTDLQAGAEVGVSRVYTHLTPLQSLKKALKTPFRNLIVALNQRQTFKKCAPIMDFSGDVNEEIVKECFKILDEEFEVGESLIIADNLDFGGNLRFGQTLDGLLKAFAELRGKTVSIRKTHLHRASKDEFHLYIDKGMKGSLRLSFGLTYGIQILSIGHERAIGQLGTNFHPWKTKEAATAKEKAKFLKGLMRYIRDSRTDFITANEKPFRVKHNFKTKQTDLNILFWQNAWRSNQIRTTLIHQKDEEAKFAKEFVTYSRGKRTGKNYVQLVSRTLAELLSEGLDDDRINVDLGDDRDPANTPFGSSHTREISMESEVIKENGKETLDQPQVKLNLSWRGWKIKKSKANEIVKKINTMFDFPFFHENVFQQTDNIQVYNIGVRVTLYKDFIEKLVNIDNKVIQRYLEKNYSHYKYDNGHGNKSNGIDGIMGKIRWYKSRWEKHRKNSNKVKTAAKNLTKYIDLIEAYIPFKDLVQLVGSDQYFAIGSVRGFREGDENGDQSFFSHGMGTVGQKYAGGVYEAFRAQTGMIPNEYYGHWFIGKL